MNANEKKKNGEHKNQKSANTGTAENLTTSKGKIETKQGCVFKLEISPAKKGSCPGCGKTGEFRYYQDLPRIYGVCERKNKCSYHKDPNKESKEIKKELYAVVGNSTTVITPFEKSIIYPDQDYLSKVLENQNTNFHNSALALGIAKEHLIKWGVGGETVQLKEGKVTQTCFVYQNFEKPLNVKKISYLQTGKRNKDIVPFYLYTKDKNLKYDLCLFGEHLLSKSKIICLVESEKTAVFASFFYAKFDWLATGGAQGLTDAKMEILFGREVYYLCDADVAGRNSSSLKKLKGYKIHFTLIDLFPERIDGSDLADYIFEGLRPEIKPIEKIKSIKEIEAECFEKHQFFERNNEYYTLIQGKNFTKEIKISNFRMNWIYRLNNETENTPMLIELIQIDKPSVYLEITSENLLNLSKFSAVILKDGLNFNGTSYIFKNILTSLHPQSKEAVYISSLGQNLGNDFYCFFDGVLKSNGEYIKCNEHGVIEINDNCFYLPSGKKGNEKISNSDDERKFKFVPGTLDLNTFIEKIYSIYQISGLIGLCYTIAAIHRDIIFNETKFFPFLFLYGSKGSGKSTYINFFMSLFGEPQPETTEESTDKAIERKFAQINNNLQYIKEFSPTFEEKIKNILKNAYDGVGYSRAQMSNDNKTKTSIVRSALAIDGNYFPTQDDALFSRLIFLLWEPIFTETTKGEIQSLQDDLSAGNGLLFSEIYKQRDKYQSNFKNQYRLTIDELKKHCKSKKIIFTEREISHLSLMTTVFKLSIKEILPTDIAYNLFNDFLIKGALKQKQITQSIDDVNKFFEIMDTLSQQSRIIEHRHFIREQNIGFDYLYLNFNLCQTEYAKIIKETGDKLFISKEGLKQKLEFSVSKNYNYTKVNEIYFQKKFSGTNTRCFVFEVEPYSFTLINSQSY